MPIGIRAVQLSYNNFLISRTSKTLGELFARSLAVLDGYRTGWPSSPVTEMSRSSTSPDMQMTRRADGLGPPSQFEDLIHGYVTLFPRFALRSNRRAMFGNCARERKWA